MNVGIIFLALLIGCGIGFEVGKYIMGKKVETLLSAFAGKLKKEAEDAQKRRDEAKHKMDEAFDNLMDALKNAATAEDIQEEKENADNTAALKEENSI